MTAFHLCMGLEHLASWGLECKGMLETVKVLSRYGKNPLVRRMVKELVRGRYINQIEQKAWKVKIWGASLLCSLHAYVLLTLGIWCCRKLNCKLTIVPYSD